MLSTSDYPFGKAWLGFMKKIMLMAAMVLAAMSVAAKDIKKLVVTTTPIMYCENCENKVKNGMRFVKGVKKIETSVSDQTVTITYDADKNNEETIIKSFGKIGYKAEKVEKENTHPLTPPIKGGE